MTSPLDPAVAAQLKAALAASPEALFDVLSTLFTAIRGLLALRPPA